MALYLINGLAFGSLLFILSSGFTLALGLIRSFNVAYGAFYLVGAHLAVSVAAGSGSLLAAAAVSCAVLAVLGAAVQRVFLNRLHHQALAQVLFTMGLALIIGEACTMIWGGYPRLLQLPSWLSGSVQLLGLQFPRYRLFVIGLAAAVALGLWLLIDRTRLGMLVRACIDDEEMARGMGVDVNRLFHVMFGFTALLAGLGGAVGAPFIGAYPGVEFELLAYILVVVVLGGLGSIPGALAGSLLIGLIDSLGKALLPELAHFLLFAPMVLILLLRPQGLAREGTSP